MYALEDAALKKSKKATQTIFLVCGLGISSWAIMVPYAKERLALNDSSLGVLLLMLGAGAIAAMPVTGLLISRFGSRLVILVSALLVALALPLLLIMNTPVLMGLVLFLFGAGIGAVDVAMNAHGVHVQNLYDKPIMSSLHGLFSVGGLLGPLTLGFLIKAGLAPIIAALSISAILILIVSMQYRFLLSTGLEKQISHSFNTADNATSGNRFSWLNKTVIYLGVLCFALFLAEGALLDWSAVFLKENRNIDVAFAGIGYATFSVAMATMRLLGDRLITRLDSKKVVVYGSFIASAGLLLTVLTPWLITSLLGFTLVGIGAANIVPVFFSEGGRIRNVSAAAAIPAIATFGYAGQLAGPATLGFIAQHTSLPTALGFTGLLLSLVAVSYGSKKSNP